MRIRVFLLALVGVLVTCLPLLAFDEPPFTVGIFPLQDESASLLHQIGEAGYAYANLFVVPNAPYAQHLVALQQKNAELSRIKSITMAYASKSENKLEEARQAPPAIDSNTFETLRIIYKEIPYQEGYAKLLNNYTDARPWYASKENYNALILLKKTKLATNDRIRIYWYDLFSDTITLIFDQVVMQKDPSELQQEIGSALLTVTAGEKYGLLVFDNYSSSLSIEINAEPLTGNEAQKLLISGEYFISFKNEGYEPKQLEVTILPNSINHVSASLQRIVVPDIRLTSPMGKVSWYVDGTYFDTKCELSIGVSLLPLVVVAQKKGFASMTLQVHKPVHEIEVSLKPEWMARSSLLKEEQRGFYNSLRNTMLIFGLYVASSTLSRTFDRANPLWQPLQVATSGFALVSSLHTIMNLASYVALAGSGVR